MDAPPSNPQAPASLDSVSLRVISQLPEPNDTLSFPDVPLDITVGDLKRQIKSRIDFQPQESDQRLIYRGRMLVRETDKLRDVFGQEGVDKSQPLALHLVIRDVNARNPSSQRASSQPRTGNPAQASIGDPLRAMQEAVARAQGIPQAQPMAPSRSHQGSVPGGNHPHGHPPHVRPPPPPFPFAPPFNPMVNPFAIAGAQNGVNGVVHQAQALPGGVTMVHTPYGPRLVPPGHNIHEHIQNGFPPFPSFGPPPGQAPQDPNIATQGHAPHTNLPHTTQPLDPASNAGVNSRSAPPASSPQDHTHPSNAPSTVQGSSWQSQGIGQNGERWTVTMNSNFPVPAAIQNPGRLPMMPRFPVPPAMLHQNNPQAGPQNLLSSTSLQHHHDLLQALECLIRCRDSIYGIERHLTQEISNIRIRSARFVAQFITENMIGTIQTRNRAQVVVNQTLSSHAATEQTLQALGMTTASLRALEREFRDVVSRLRVSLDNLLQPSSSNAPSQPRGDVSGYLLASPNSQQQALLFDSQGALVPEQPTHSTSSQDGIRPLAEQMTQIIQDANRHQAHRHQQHLPHHAHHHQNHPPRDVHHDHQPAHHEPPAQADPHPDAPDEAAAPNDLGILLPILRALWILARVAIFIWVFSSGSMTRRSWLLCLSAIIVFAAQAAVVRTQLDRVRQYFEDILAGPDARPDWREPRRDVQADHPAADAPRRQRAAPTPEATAERLLREARHAQQGRVQEVFRAVERVLVLFLGSLYPGVGERQVQARERLVREQEQERRDAQAALPAPPASGQSGNSEGQNETSAQQPREETPGGVAGSNDDGGVGSSTSANPTAGSVGEVRQRAVESGPSA